MTEPQVWALIGVFAAALVGVIGFVMTSISRQISSLGEIVTIRFDEVNRRFEQIDRRFEQVDKRFERLETKLEGLDRDVTWLMKRAADDQPE